MSYLAIDVGTTGCKAKVIDPAGCIMSSAYREYPLIHPRPGWSELDPELVWRQVKDTIREAAAHAKGNIRALAVSAQGEAVVPLDRQGRVLDHSMVTFDTRADEVLPMLMARYSRAEIFNLTGMPPSGMYTLGKLLWLKERKREVFDRTWKFLCFEDYIHYKLGLPVLIDYSLAGKTMLLEVEGKKWAPSLLEFLDLRPEQLAEPCPSGTILGAIGPEIAVALGLPKGLVAVAGAHDQAAAALGAGVIDPGVGLDSTGTTESIALISPRPILTEGMLASNLPCYPYVLPETYLTVGFNLVAGALLQWFRDVLGGDEVRAAAVEGKAVYDVMMERASSAPSDVLVLPHFAFSGTPYCDGDSRGAVVGLTLSTTRADLLKGFIEGATYAMKINLKILNKLGFNPTELRAVGGGAKSRIWLQLKADMFETKIVSLAIPDSACLGVAILSALALGDYHSAAEAVRAMVHVEETYLPDNAAASVYNERLPMVERLYPAVKAVYHGFSS